MEVVALSRFHTGSLLWQPRAGSFALTVVCKLTFQLLPGESELADLQEPLCDDDLPTGEGASASVYKPCDLVPRKARADITLVGHAFAPRGEALRSLVARLVIGQVDKEVEIFGERFFGRDGHIHEGSRFSRMPLRYDRAAGGPGTANPAGVRTGPGAVVDPQGQVPLPNLQVPGATPADRSEVMAPIGFGPVPRSFPLRKERLGRAPAPEEAFATVPLPDDFDVGYFNAAPRDQQVSLLRDNERIILQNLHREHARLLTSLPGIHPRAYLQRVGVAPRELGLNCDALWIDTDRAICTLTFRGQVALKSPDEPGRVLFAMERPGERLLFEDVERLAGPFREPVASPAPSAELRTSALPLMPLPEPVPSPEPGAHLRTSVVAMPRFEAPLPFQAPVPGAPPPPSPSSPSSPPAAPERGGMRRQMVQTSAVPFEMPSKHVAPAWLGSTPAPPAAVSPPRMVPPPAPVPEPLRAWETPPPRPPMRSESYLPPSPAQHPPGEFSLMAASNAAAEATQAREARPSMPDLVLAPARAPREAIDLLWVDPSAIRAIRAAFPELLAAIKPPAKTADKDEAKRLELERIEAEATRVLSSGKRAEAASLEEILAEAVSEEGRFRAPLVVLGGELRLVFDELEALKAMVGAAGPVAAPDTPLGAAVDQAIALLGSPFAGSAPGAAERLGQQLREAFVQQNRTLPQTWLDDQAERVMLEQRRHQRRTVTGEVRIRALFAAPGGGALIPCYLPEALGKVLPMYASIEVRLLAEAHPQQDPREGSAISLQVKALGRVLSLGKRR